MPRRNEEGILTIGLFAESRQFGYLEKEQRFKGLEKNSAPGRIGVISVSLNRLADSEKQKWHVYLDKTNALTFQRSAGV